MVSRFHSNSSVIGVMKAPNPFRAPTAANPTNTAAATTYHPKYTGRRVGLFALIFLHLPRA